MESKEFTKETLEAVRIIDGLYSLKRDIDLASIKLKEFNKRSNGLFCGLNKSSNNEFNHFIPKMFCDLLDAIERGDLTFKDA
jgi:hypothetical protein